MLRIARAAKNAIEQVPGVLSAELRGSREEAVEIIVEPMLLKSYGVSLDQLISTVNASNSLIAAGALEGDTGRFAVKVPGLIERPQDVLKVPVAATSGATITVGDVARCVVRVLDVVEDGGPFGRFRIYFHVREVGPRRGITMNVNPRARRRARRAKRGARSP